MGRGGRPLHHSLTRRGDASTYRPVRLTRRWRRTPRPPGRPVSASRRASPRRRRRARCRRRRRCPRRTGCEPVPVGSVAVGREDEDGAGACVLARCAHGERLVARRGRCRGSERRRRRRRRSRVAPDAGAVLAQRAGTGAGLVGEDPDDLLGRTDGQDVRGARTVAGVEARPEQVAGLGGAPDAGGLLGEEEVVSAVTPRWRSRGRSGPVRRPGRSCRRSSERRASRGSRPPGRRRRRRRSRRPPACGRRSRGGRSR